MSDVTAVILSIGEEYTARAIASVRRQTLPVRETIVVRGISPFYRAINAAAARVSTPFFVQVDADMILDDTCVADLRSCMSDGSGVVIGQLWDPLRGSITGIKLFRTRCFESVQFRNSVCQDIDFSDDILRQAGWTKVHALKYCGEGPTAWHSFGEHRPDYTPHYTFCKFMVEGARARSRKAEGKFRRLLRQLQGSTHDMTPIAVIGTAHGLFLTEDRDRLVPYAGSEDSELLQQFLRHREAADVAVPADMVLVNGDLAAGFKHCFERATHFRQQQKPAAFMATLQRLHQQDSIASSVALIGLCHGLFFDAYREAEADAAFASLRELLPNAAWG